MSTLSEIVTGLTREGDAFTATITDNWRQGRTAFGGISAALCYEAAIRGIEDLPPLRSAQFAFPGPATGIVRATATTLRRGRSTAFINVDLVGEDGLAVHALLCFGAARESALHHKALAPPPVSAPAACPEAFTNRGPGFIGNFEVRDAHGDMKDPVRTLWLRHRDIAARTSIAGLIALADAPPPSAINLFPKPGPVSTMTWMFDVLSDAPASDDGWWLMHNVADTIEGGYSSQSSAMWNSEGSPIMIARQNVAVFI